MLNLIFVIHNHQPLGNIPDVFRKAYEVSYKPFLDIVRKHPKIKWALHTSGCLMEWIDENEPEYFEILKGEIADGRLEIVGGGMWEPIQPIFTERNLKLQFDLMKKFIGEKFGVAPAGSWTTERVWEPELASRLSKSGMEFTLLDDSQFRSALPSPDEHKLWGYYRTEADGNGVSVFPIDEKLRYLIPFAEAEKVVKHIENRALELPDGASITYGDDGEKFGMWPDTHEWVYKKGWLDKFFTLLEQSELIETIHPSEYLKKNPYSRGHVYLPTSSYREMGVWNLFPERNLAAEKIHHMVEEDEELSRIQPPHSEGHFRNFLSRYPESRLMYERTSEIVRFILNENPGAIPEKKSNDALSSALWHVLRAQCNCAYWHGVFGGIYLNFIRFENHREILTAEKILSDAGIHKTGARNIGATISSGKTDPDSLIGVNSGDVMWVIDPRSGQIVSAGSLVKRIDVIDVVARRKEAYHMTMIETGAGDSHVEPATIHEKVDVAPEGWSDGFGYDLFRRGCFFDRVTSEPLSLEQLATVKYETILGTEEKPWDSEITDKFIKLFRNDGEWRREKVIEFADGKAEMIWKVENKSEELSGKYLYLEFNFGLLAGNANDRFHTISKKKYKLETFMEFPGVNKDVLKDGWTGVEAEVSVPDADWMGIYPVKTLSRSESGLEMTYQGTCVVFRVPLSAEQKVNSLIRIE
jgi:alpha-amylase